MKRRWNLAQLKQDERARWWAALLVLQAVVAVLVWWRCLNGSLYFAFLDIGSDTYNHNTGAAMHLSRLFTREGFPGWSFAFGLGTPLNWLGGDAFRLLLQLGGPDGVLPLRIWVYLLKIVLGGGFFFLLATSVVRSRQAAMLAALAYSFCGYIVVNGQWDGEANVHVFFPLVLWGLVRCVRGEGFIALPLSVAAALWSGIFPPTLAVTIFYACAMLVALRDDHAGTARACVFRVAPLSLLGVGLAAPAVLPMMLQLLDSPRVAGADSHAAGLLRDSFVPSDIRLLLIQLGSFFHKDLFGWGGLHRGYMNYLEGPGFYVGMLPLVVLPQLWRDGPRGRRWLLVGAAAIGVYILFPFFRLAAFGFAAPYFRATTLWVALVLLLLAAAALDKVLRDGLDLPLLGVGAVLTGAILVLVGWAAGPYVSPSHLDKMVVLVIASAVALLLLRVPALRSRWVPLAAVLLVLELAAMAWPATFGGRALVVPGEEPWKDPTVTALARLRDKDPGAYRVEKTYTTFSNSDAVGQDYMGVRSYSYHGSAVVDFHRRMGLMYKFVPQPVNYTNWLPDPGRRYFLHTVLGVKYVLSQQPLDWAGFTQVDAGPGWRTYRNELALPWAVVHHRQVTRAEFAQLDKLPAAKGDWLKDVVLVNAVVLDQPLPQSGRPFDIAALAARPELDLGDDYAGPAAKLQASGLQVTHFSNDRIAGRIRAAEPGVLVFPIPFYRGWTLAIDGQPAPLLTANFGMLGAPIAAGEHEVELTYRLPGVRASLLIFLGACLLWALAHLRRKARAADAS